MADSSEQWYPVKDAPDYEISLRGGVRRADTKEPAVVSNGTIRLDLPTGGYTLVPISDLTELLLDSSTTVQLVDVVSKYPDVMPQVPFEEVP
jgi:hypothetical protein